MPQPTQDAATDFAAGDNVLAVVIPCFRVVDHVLGVIAGIGPEVRHIIVVDDACPEGSGDHVRRNCHDPRVQIVTHATNAGVGGATLTGYRTALECGADIIVKLDGDGQMDPGLIPTLIEPIVRARADYAKGNRFYWLEGLGQMPATRIVGNLLLSFACKMSSGYWNVFDPTNGFTAVHAGAARMLPFDKLAKGFFFESDMLFRLYLRGAVVADVPMPARYGNERSNLRVLRVMLPFAGHHLANAVKRILYCYFLRDFNMASIELLLGNLLFLFGLVFGVIEWYDSVVSGVSATAGTVILAALPIILGSQLLIAFLDHDIRRVPRDPLQLRLGGRSTSAPLRPGPSATP